MGGRCNFLLDNVGSLGRPGLKPEHLKIMNFLGTPKFEFLRRKVVFGYVGIVQNLKNCKKMQVLSYHCMHSLAYAQLVRLILPARNTMGL